MSKWTLLANIFDVVFDWIIAIAGLVLVWVSFSDTPPVTQDRFAATLTLGVLLIAVSTFRRTYARINTVDTKIDHILAHIHKYEEEEEEE